ncbi:hypothetical protein MTO96_036405 [Rhipicephalus appendiculatus]
MMLIGQSTVEGAKGVTILDCIRQEIPATIRPDRFVDTALLFSAVGDFKGTRFELAVDKCASPPMLAIKFTTCLFTRFQEDLQNESEETRIVIPEDFAAACEAFIAEHASAS